MKLVLRLLSLLAFISLLPGANAADASGTASGTWKGAFDFNGTSIPVTITLKIDGAKVTGTVEGLPTTPAEIRDGVLAGDMVTFWVNTDYEGQTYKLLYKGKLAADQITFDFGTADGSWSSPLTVKKSAPDATPAVPAAAAPAAAPASVPAAPAAPDVSGTWKGTFDLNGTPTELTFRLQNSGNTVTGTIERPGAPPIEVHEGKMEGGTVSFWINSEYQGETYTIVYKGKVTPGQIDFDFGTADQSWSATLTARKAS